MYFNACMCWFCRMGNKRKAPAITEDEDGKPGRKNFNWTDSLDAILISCMMDLVHKHQVQNGSFKNGAFNELESLMQQRAPGCGVQLEPHIRSRHKKLKSYFNAVHLLRNQSGSGWDEITCTASMETGAFEDLIKVVHPNCKNWNNKPFPNYYELEAVFGKSGSASGRITGGIADGVNDPSIDTPVIMDLDGVHTPIDVEDPRGDSLMEDLINEGIEMSQRTFTPLSQDTVPLVKCHGSDSKHAGGSNPIVKKKAKVIKKEQGDEDIATVAAEIGGLKPVISKALEALGTIMREREDTSYDEDALIAEIGKIEGLTRCQVVDAAMALVDNDRKTRLFYAMKNEEDRSTSS
ncbi:unnamed protein product [Linum tenue]|uniref:Myb/SANT-like domain-containing protein n=1 Tax=Linum tenue TaxID=586396 RepID=A0AAV0LB61_9ROSI|nr:unnamed protein product [Linum tenue]